MINRTFRFLPARLVGITYLLTVGFSPAAFAINLECENIEQSIVDIEKQGELYYTQSEYQFNDQKLLERIKKAKLIFDDEVYNRLVLSTNRSLNNNDKLMSSLTEIASYMHEWSGKECF